MKKELLKILLVDDEPLSREMIADILPTLIDIDVFQAANGEEALEILNNEDIKLVLTDIKMPLMGGMELLKNIKKKPAGSGIYVILMTGFSEMDSAVTALREGAYDYLSKPIDISRLIELISEIQLRIDVGNPNEADSAAVKEHYRIPLIKGGIIEVPSYGKLGIFSDIMLQSLEKAIDLNDDHRIPVLIQGEAGTYKDMFARIVHSGKSEADYNILKIKCRSLTTDYFDNQIYDHIAEKCKSEKKCGSIKTIILDNISIFDVEMQVNFYSFLERFISKDSKEPENLRIIALSDKDIARMVYEGRIIAELYDLLKPGLIRLLPLRDQRESIVPLAQIFLLELSESNQKNFRSIDDESKKMLKDYHWPGNFQELRNVIERVTLINNGPILHKDHLFFLARPENKTKRPRPEPEKTVVKFDFPDDESAFKSHIMRIARKALDKYDGKEELAALSLGLTTEEFKRIYFGRV